MAILIKKYKNRRLYDMDKSQYITFDDLQQYVLNGTEFTVQAASGGKDLTNATLLQILLEMETTSTQFLSTNVLRQLIVLSNNPAHQTMNGLMEGFLNSLKTPATPEVWSKGMDDWKKWMERWQNFGE